MIDPSIMAENVMEALDDICIDGGVPLFREGMTELTDVAVMELRPLNTEAGFSVILSNGDVYRVLVAKV